jgi:hypothetical protein
VNVSLVMVLSDGSLKEMPVKGLPISIGRDEGVKLRIPRPNVSRKHCELSINDEDELVVRDLKSSNGTYVNGERVNERELVPGDLLTVGDSVFVVRIDGHPKDIDGADSYAAGSVMLGGTPVVGAGGPKTEAISGVPTWGSGGGGGKSAAGDAKPAANAAPAPAQKKAATDDDDDDDFSDLLEGIDLSDLDDDEPSPKKK